MTEELFIETDYGYCFYTFEDYPGALIYNLYVYPQFRRQGRAKKLLQSIIDLIKSTGYTGEIGIEVAPRENSIDKKDLCNFYKTFNLKILETVDQNLPVVLVVDLVVE